MRKIATIIFSVLFFIFLLPSSLADDHIKDKSPLSKYCGYSLDEELNKQVIGATQKSQKNITQKKQT